MLEITLALEHLHGYFFYRDRLKISSLKETKKKWGAAHLLMAKFPWWVTAKCKSQSTWGELWEGNEGLVLFDKNVASHIARSPFKQEFW